MCECMLLVTVFFIIIVFVFLKDKQSKKVLRRRERKRFVRVFCISATPSFSLSVFFFSSISLLRVYTNCS